jgi:hypothetical protein
VGHIYWIASYPKSGNTWMRSFLARLVLGEEASINALWSFAPDENYGAFYQPLLKGPIAEASISEQAEVRPRAQAQIAAAVEGFQFLKTHTMHVRHAGTPTINAAATAGAIYLVRNPLDIAVSYGAFRKRGIDETIAVLNQAGRILPRNFKHAYVPCGSWSEHVTSWTRSAHDRLLVLRYEDLLADPTSQFARVPELLRMQVEPEALEAAIAATSFSRLQEEEQEQGFTERPEMTEQFFRRGEANQWRTELTEAQIAAVVRPNRAVMTAMGYWEPDFDQL